ncbi:MAG: extracellular solute-binding protein [Planctomycetota bacterium]
MRVYTLAAALLCLAFACGCDRVDTASRADAPREVVFWHFWGGRDRPVVDDVIRRFNESQADYRVRGVAMPGANLDLKVFLSLAGGDPPDLLNHDDPIIADWAVRGALTSLDTLASGEEIADLDAWLLPTARELSRYDGRYYALVNGIDIRALYYNKTWLEELGLAPPTTLEELDRIAEAIAPADRGLADRAGYLPDPRRLWAWGPVFGGAFEDASATGADRVTLANPQVADALRWMASYADRYGADRVASFRTGDQALTGATFPLLADRRYAAIMDGQWRVRDIAEARERSRQRGEPFDQIRVTPLPPPDGGVADAGWVNGNFFVVPRGAKRADGAWEFMKFWVGLGGREAEAAETAAAGGWIPPSRSVIDEPRYQQLLQEEPLLRVFVRLAASKAQRPTPVMPGGGVYYREVVAAAQDVVYRGADVEARLNEAQRRVRRHMESIRVLRPVREATP